MRNLAVVGSCRICSQGRLIVARENNSGRLYVSCEECESEWSDPTETTDIDAATRERFGMSTLVEREELDGHPWQPCLEH